LMTLIFASAGGFWMGGFFGWLDEI
jgi:hypothetical protein